ncbi:MAG: uracil phosphoribosyltransferase, partial [Acidaminococcaceae bacterium]
MKVNVVDHPLIRHKLTLMRQSDAGSKDFRELLDEIAMLMTYEVTRQLPTRTLAIETPVAKCMGECLAVESITVVPILRAGLGMVNGVLKLIPNAKVGHIGLYRDPQTLEPIEYYCKMPPNTEAEVFVVDPMLATGGSSAAAITMLKNRGFKNIRLMCLVAAPEGVKVMNAAHPDVEIYTAGLDDHLNEHGYIVP